MSEMETKSPLEVARENHAAAWREYNIAKEATKAAETALGEAKNAENVRYRAAEEATSVLRRKEHLAKGLCAHQIQVGDGYRITYRPCEKKAKSEGVCGVHLNSKRRAEELAARVRGRA